jgi:hypothetical protein
VLQALKEGTYSISLYLDILTAKRWYGTHTEIINILGTWNRLYVRYVNFNNPMTLHVVLKPFTFISMERKWNHLSINHSIKEKTSQRKLSVEKTTLHTGRGGTYYNHA